MMVFESWLTEGISELSYMVGDDEAGKVAVIDPRPDVEAYLDKARELGVSITHVFETHIHADFMSGARELAARCGSATLYASGEGGASYGFDLEKTKDGDEFVLGSLALTSRFTPGHTPEHISYELCHSEQPESPFAVLTGDSLFVDSVGRPDLLGEKETEALVEQLYRTLWDYYLKLSDNVIIYPCHGKGSACGPAIGERIHSTIGFERKHNRFLQHQNLKDFKEAMLGDAPPAPTHYTRLKKVNREGPPLLGAGPRVPALRPKVFREKVKGGGAQLVDTRHMLAYGGGHIPGALNLSADKDELTVFAGWVLDPEKEIYLVLEEDVRLDEVVRHLLRSGYTRFGGYLAGGMTAWQNFGLPLRALPQMHVKSVHETDGDLQVLDVRSPEEWEGGHIPGATHHFLGKLVDEQPSLDPGKPVVTYCATGYRASIATGLLLEKGFEDVRNMPGSWKAWKKAGLPVEQITEDM